MTLARTAQGWVILCVALAALSAPAAAVDLRCRTAKLVVPWAPGGGTAIIFGLITDTINQMGARPRLQVVTMPGQGGNKGAKAARRAKPDGCTLLAIHQSAMTSYLTGRVNFTWDAFAPVALLTHTPSIIGASGKAGFDDMSGLIAAAAADPDKILAGATLGSTSDFLLILIEQAAGIRFRHVSYDGTRERLTALLAGNIDIGEINVVSSAAYIETGELKALGIASESRDPRLPNLPTLREQGIDLVAGIDRGVVLPKDTPVDVGQHYQRLFADAMNDPQLRAALEAKGNTVRFVAGADYRTHLGQTFAELEQAARAAGLTTP